MRSEHSRVSSWSSTSLEQSKRNWFKRGQVSEHQLNSDRWFIKMWWALRLWRLWSYRPEVTLHYSSSLCSLSWLPNDLQHTHCFGGVSHLRRENRLGCSSREMLFRRDSRSPTAANPVSVPESVPLRLERSQRECSSKWVALRESSWRNLSLSKSRLDQPTNQTDLKICNFTNRQIIIWFTLCRRSTQLICWLNIRCDYPSRIAHSLSLKALSSFSKLFSLEALRSSKLLRR